MLNPNLNLSLLGREASRCSSKKTNKPRPPSLFHNCSLAFLLETVWSIIECALRTSAFRSCALREQKQHIEGVDPFVFFGSTSLLIRQHQLNRRTVFELRIDRKGATHLTEPSPSRNSMCLSCY